MAFMASSAPVTSFLTSPDVSRHIATSPAQAIVAHGGDRKPLNDDDTDSDLFYCHFCLGPLLSVSQECPSCLYPHKGDLRYVNLGNASDQSCAGGALVRGIMAMKAKHNHHREGPGSPLATPLSSNASPPKIECRSRSYAMANIVTHQLLGPAASTNGMKQQPESSKQPINRVASSGLLFEMDT